MKVTKVVPFLVDSGVGGNWLFIKLETDEGVVGWGESFLTHPDRSGAVYSMVQSLGRYLIGRDPFNIKHFCLMAYADFSKRRGALEFYSALSGIELAMWDVAGKALGMPVYKLLGGKCRDKIQVYANGWYSGKVSDQEIAERAKSMVKRGFMAMKFDPFPGPWRSFISVNEEDQAIERIKVIRDAVGPDIGLLVEAHRRLSPNNAIRFAKRLEPLNPYWFEEPTDCQNIDEMAQVAARTDLVLVMGEALYNKVEFIDVFTKHAASVVNPDVCNCGILELKEIAAMAEAFSVMVSPHNFNSTASGTAATIQVSACIPNFRITEYFVSFEEVGNRLCVSPLPLQDGYILLDDSRPGLGVELIEEELLRNPGREFPIRPFRQYYEEP